MLRHVELNNQLCIQDENHELFLKHDLKGNQFDTLAYLFYKEQNKGLLGKEAGEFAAPALNFYRECEKEAVESFRQCCKHGNLRVLWEFYLYERLCANSSNRVVVDQVLADQILHGFDKKVSTSESSMANAQWLLDSNYEKLFKRTHKLAFNTDLVQIQFQAYFTRSVFNFDLVGPFKDIHLLKAKCLIDRAFVKLINGKTNEIEENTLTLIRQEIAQIRQENLRSFDDYFVYRRVNNPTTNPDIVKRRTYNKEQLDSHTETMILGLHMLQDFLELYLIFANEKSGSMKIEESVLQCAALEKVKTVINDHLKGLLIKDQAAFSGHHYFVLSHLLRTVFTLISLYNRLSQDLKASLKQLTKTRSEVEKDQISKCLSQYSSLKEYFKEASKTIEDSLKGSIITKQYELKETIFADIGLVWPSILKENHPKVSSHYTSMMHNALLELDTRLSMMRKSIN
jgi:hypothetical protein